MAQPQSLYEMAGGAPKLRAVIRDFYEAILADPMIGFMFQNADKERLIEKELELMAMFFGAKDLRYSGDQLKSVHSKHRILGGHFDRRLQLLKEALDRHELPKEVKDAWIEHTIALRPLITKYGSAECDDNEATVATLPRKPRGL